MGLAVIIVTTSHKWQTVGIKCHHEMTVPHVHIFGLITEHKLIKLFNQVQVISNSSLVALSCWFWLNISFLLNFVGLVMISVAALQDYASVRHSILPGSFMIWGYFLELSAKSVLEWYLLFFSCSSSTDPQRNVITIIFITITSTWYK